MSGHLISELINTVNVFQLHFYRSKKRLILISNTQGEGIARLKTVLRSPRAEGGLCFYPVKR